MNRIDLIVSGKKRTYTGPSGWEEVTSRKQFVRLTRLVFLGELIRSVRFAALKAVYGMSPFRAKELFSSKDYGRDHQDSILTTADQNAILGQKLLKTTDWIWNTLPHSKWHFPVIRILHKKYTGPGDGFSDMTFGQFIFVERYFSAIHKGADDYKFNLQMFLGSVFLEKGNPFMMDNISRNARWLRLLKPRTQEAILHNYSGLRNTLVRSFPEIFESDPDTKPKQKTGKSSGWLDVALSLAGDDLAKLHTYEENNLWLVMKVIHNAVLRSREMEQIVNKSKK